MQEITNGMSGAQVRAILNNALAEIEELKNREVGKTLTTLEGEVDGKNRYFESKIPFKEGSTALYVNGVRMFLNIDYKENSPQQIELIAYVPSPGNNLILEIIKK